MYFLLEDVTSCVSWNIHVFWCRLVTIFYVQYCGDLHHTVEKPWKYFWPQPSYTDTLVWAHITLDGVSHCRDSSAHTHAQFSDISLWQCLWFCWRILGYVVISCDTVNQFHLRINIAWGDDLDLSRVEFLDAGNKAESRQSCRYMCLNEAICGDSRAHAESRWDVLTKPPCHNWLNRKQITATMSSTYLLPTNRWQVHQWSLRSTHPVYPLKPCLRRRKLQWVSFDLCYLVSTWLHKSALMTSLHACCADYLEAWTPCMLEWVVRSTSSLDLPMCVLCLAHQDAGGILRVGLDTAYDCWTKLEVVGALCTNVRSVPHERTEQCLLHSLPWCYMRVWFHADGTLIDSRLHPEFTLNL